MTSMPSDLNCFSFLQPFAKIHGNYFEQSLKGTPEGRIDALERIRPLIKTYYISENVFEFEESYNPVRLEEEEASVFSGHCGTLALDRESLGSRPGFRLVGRRRGEVRQGWQRRLRWSLREAVLSGRSARA